MTTSYRTVVGCMTGTSIDAIDTALLHITGHGLRMQARLVRTHSAPLGPLADDLRSAATGQPRSAAWFADLALRFGQFHADTITELSRGERIDLVASHGQTVYHAPPASWQLINPWPIAARLGCAVVTDLRGADLALGGEGAPITPLADWILLRSATNPRVIVNLGGFCNITMLPAGDDPAGVEAIRGRDVCVCNQLLDAVVRTTLGVAYDDQGLIARRGEAYPQALDHLGAVLRETEDEPSTRPRSLGTGDEGFGWIEAWRDRLSPEDLAATATRAIGTCIGEAIARDVAIGAELILAGGGARHALLAETIQQVSGCVARPISECGLEVDAREAACMGVLGALAQDGLGVSLPSVTGRADRAIPHGCWTGTPPAAHGRSAEPG